jgi:hypothetical protein
MLVQSMIQKRHGAAEVPVEVVDIHAGIMPIPRRLS